MESLRLSRNFLSADDRYNEDSKSMESLSSSSETHSSRSHYRSFLTSSTRDVRRIMTVESKSSENLREESMNAEVRRGLFANTGLERKIPQHLSLPPPTSVFSLTSPGGSDRKITILSPHSPLQTSEFQFSTLKNRRKKAIVLPRLVLPRSESEVFLEWVVEWLNFLPCHCVHIFEVALPEAITRVNLFRCVCKKIMELKSMEIYWINSVKQRTDLNVMNLLTKSEITYVYAITTRFCGYISRKIYLLHTALIRDVNYCNVNDYFIMTNWICYRVNTKLYMKTLCGCARWCCDIIIVISHQLRGSNIKPWWFTNSATIQIHYLF